MAKFNLKKLKQKATLRSKIGSRKKKLKKYKTSSSFGKKKGGCGCGKKKAIIR